MFRGESVRACRVHRQQPSGAPGLREAARVRAAQVGAGARMKLVVNQLSARWRCLYCPTCPKPTLAAAHAAPHAARRPGLALPRLHMQEQAPRGTQLLLCCAAAAGSALCAAVPSRDRSMSTSVNAVPDL
jgi:hypothetical protein